MTKLLILLSLLLVLVSCGGNSVPAEGDPLRAMHCPTTEKTYSYDEIEYEGGKGSGVQSFGDLRDGINSACMSCHMAPAQSGGFSYIDSYRGAVRTIAGQTQFYPGFYETAETVKEYLFHADPARRMPPLERREKNPEAFISLGNKTQAWIAAGKPEGSFSLDPNAPPPPPRKPIPRQPKRELHAQCRHHRL